MNLKDYFETKVDEATGARIMAAMDEAEDEAMEILGALENPESTMTIEALVTRVCECIKPFYGYTVGTPESQCMTEKPEEYGRLVAIMATLLYDPSKVDETHESDNDVMED